MFKKFIVAAATAIVISACGNEVPEVKNPVPVGDQTEVGTESATPVENLKTKAVDQNDFHGQAKSSLAFLQEELNKATGKVPGIGKTTVLLDDNLTMIVRNELDGKIEETKANLKSLNADPKSLEVFPEGVKGEYPGFRMFVQKGKPQVEVTVNGKTNRQDYLEFFLAERSSVERVLSGLMQAVRSAQGNGIPAEAANSAK